MRFFFIGFVIMVEEFAQAFLQDLPLEAIFVIQALAQPEHQIPAPGVLPALFSRKGR